MLRLGGSIWVDGGGVSDEGMTVVPGPRMSSSLAWVLKDWLGSIGEAGTSVDGRVICDESSTRKSWGVDGARGLLTASCAPTQFRRGAPDARSRGMMKAV